MKTVHLGTHSKNMHNTYKMADVFSAKNLIGCTG